MYTFTSKSPAHGVKLTTRSESQEVNSILHGTKWNSNTLTFAIPKASDYFTSKVGDESLYIEENHVSGFVTASSANITEFNKVLSQYSAVSNLSFTQASDNTRADIVLAYTTSDINAAGDGRPPLWQNEGGIWIVETDQSNGIGTHGNCALLHEVGHTLGLKHPHELTGHDETPLEQLDPTRDSLETTVMSYIAYAGGALGSIARYDIDFPQTLMTLDIAAIQFMYGANFNTQSGNNIYTFNSTTGEMSIDGVGQGASNANRIFRTIWDGNGNDTYDLSNYTTNLKIDLTPGGKSTFSTEQLAELGDGHFASGNVFNALLYEGDGRSLIENATGGSGNDTIIGNVADNNLKGNAGDDDLNGATGNDHLIGGLGKDKLNGDIGKDFVRYDDGEYGNLIIDLADSTKNRDDAIKKINVVQGDTYIGIEGVFSGNGNDTLSGNDGVNDLFGQGGHDNIYGRKGNDILDGGTGADSLYGGEGEDKHIGGNDSSWDLARYDDANYGNLVINMSNTSLNTGAAKGDTYDGIEGIHGGDGNDTITGLDNSLKGEFLYGGRGHDHIYGLKGNDSLNGGIGADNLYGGEGADIHFGDDGGADGTNRDYARYDDANYGNLVINMSNTSLNTGAAKGDTYSGIEGVIGGVGNDTITGYDLLNKMEDLQGGRGNDFIYALAGDDDLNGGAGDDHLYGGAGDDYHIGALGNDHLYGGTGVDVHDGGEGIDIANYGDADYGNLTISLDANIANKGAAAVGDTYISIEGLAGSNGVDFIFGDDKGNYLFGDKGNDVLNAGDGNDNLYGGWGADNHIGGIGIDLARYDELNFGDLTINLGNSTLNKGDAAVGDTYTEIEGLVAGAGNDTVIGNVSDNSLYGLGGNDTISGLLGNDTLFGGAGADQFRFDTKHNSLTNVDVIKDFDTNADKIALSKAIFTKIGTTLDNDEFFIGAAAKDTNDYLIYKQTTGALFYDADGSGTGAQVHFATITAGIVLGLDDFLMFS